ncbi:MAG: hypothetical protein CMQ17_06105 [Gammaproteobacteria bacterium]|nr:hypothetical protein [Gammaproteobacteria bacterium]
MVKAINNFLALWVFGDDRIAVRFAYEWHGDEDNWLTNLFMSVSLIMDREFRKR